MKTRFAPALRALLATCLTASLASSQESKALFDATVEMTVDRFEQLIDFDSDGYVDAMTAWWTFDEDLRISGLMNDGAGGLVSAWAIVHTDVALPGPQVSNIFTSSGDLNGDGVDDFAVGTGERIFVYLADGSSPAILNETLPVPFTVEWLELADFDQNGLADMVVRGEDGTYHTYMNGGEPAGHSLALAQSVVLPGFVVGTTVGEFTGDSVLDLAVVLENVNRVRIYPLAAQGSIVLAPTIFVTPDLTNPMITSGDVDGDGDQDVVVFDPTQYLLFRRSTSSTFVQEPPAVGGPATDLADVDGDGDLDGVCCSNGTGEFTPGPPFLPSDFQIAINDGAGAFAPSFSIANFGSSRIAGVADLDHDGDADLVAGRGVYYAEAPMTGPVHPPIGSGPQTSRSVSDFDRDGDPDLEFGLDGVQRNEGTGSYAWASIPMPAAPAGSTFTGPGYLGDWDGDGDEDLVVAELSGAFLGMRLLTNQGGGTFEDAGAAGSPGLSFSLMGDVQLPREAAFPADADGDGDLDLIARTVSGPNPESRIFWNDGTGFFTAGPAFRGLVIKTVVELNGDANPDFVYVAEDPRYALGLGGGAFELNTPEFDLFDEMDPHAGEIVVGDIDADADIDVMSVTNDQVHGESIHVNTNDGAGSFSHSYLFPNANSFELVSNLHLADVDGDGFEDLLIWPARGTLNATSVRLREPDGTGWEAGIHLVFGATAFADVDGDGDTDALGAAAFANRRFEGASAGRRRQYGVGSPGTGGVVPVLGAAGPFRVGEDIEIRFTGGVGGGQVQLTMGMAESAVPNPAPFQDTTAYNAPWFRRLPFYLSGTPGAAGEGAFTLAVAVPAGIAGLTIYHQALVFDPGAASGLAATGGLEIHYE